jgi:hypothetical protein
VSRLISSSTNGVPESSWRAPKNRDSVLSRRKTIFDLQTVHTGSESHQVLHSVDTGDVDRRLKRLKVRLKNHPPPIRDTNIHTKVCK